jgi:hypothetical protein
VSERDFNPSADDNRILSLLDDLQDESGGLSAVVNSTSREDGSAAEVDRPYLELLGLMPYALEQPELPAELGERILSSITQPFSEVRPSSSETARQVTLEEAPAEIPVSEEVQNVHHFSPPRSNRWLLPLAASLTALFLGLSTWQFYKLEEQSAMIAAISSELSAQSEQNETFVAMRTKLSTTTNRLSMITNPGVEICALRPVGADPMYPAARGILYVAPDHQNWYLSMEGLQPRPAGESYQLWFHAKEGTVDAGTFRIGSSSKMELSSETMPLDTTAVSITVEPEGGMPQPTGREVLYGSEVMQIF